jgi:choline dehydrogenase-like flavoprotein
MRKSFDVVIIGAGPTAVAALSAAPPGARICAVTGIASFPLDREAKIRPKIRSVAYEHCEAPGLSDFLAFDGGRGAGLFSTAAVGGLANYWGQHFVRYSEGDPWPSEFFDSYSDYERTCLHIEAMFALTPPTSETGWNDAEIGGGYLGRMPRLLVGTDKEPQSGLHAMRGAFQNLAASLKVRTIPLRATSWTIDGDGVCVMLSNGENVRGSLLILACGVLGTLRLAMESCPELAAVQFSDHNPYLLYTYGLDRILRLQRADGVLHFNTLTIESIDRGRSHLFASVYRMSHAPFSLLLTIAGMPPCLRGWPAPPFVDLVKPLQVWTEGSKVRFRFDRNRGTVIKTDPPEAEVDDALGPFVRYLKSHGVLMRVAATEPGAGFHYHATDVTVDGLTFIRLCQYIEDRFKGRVIVVDSSVLGEIGCRPPTLTAMASAHRLSCRAWQTL